MSVLLVKVVLLLLSLAGYCKFLQKQGLEVAFAPVITISSISLALYFGGFFGLLPYLAPIIYLGGFVLGTLSLEWDHPRKPVTKHSHETLVYIVFFLGSLLLFFRLKDELVKFIDSYGHWALIVKEMLATDAYPSAPDSFITHQGYPPGTAVFLYYVCKVTESSDGMMHVGQAILSVSCLCAFCAFVKKELILSTIIIAVGSVYLLISNVGINLLAVDTMLPLLAIVSFSAMTYYRSDPKKALLCSSIILTYLCIVKNSAVFFALLHTILALGMFSSTPGASRTSLKRNVWITAVTFGIPVLMLLLWNRHIALAFPAGEVSRHSFTLANCLKVFGEKSLSDVGRILLAFVVASMTPKRWSIVLAALGGMLLVGHRLQKGQYEKNVPNAQGYLKWSILSYVAYLIGLMGMYLFSMPRLEAIHMSAFARYYYVIVQYLFGVGMVYMLQEIQNMQQKHLYTYVVLPAIVCVSLLPMMHFFPTLLRSQPVELVLGRECKPTLGRVCREYNVPEGKRYCIITSSEAGVYDVEARYVLLSDDFLLVESPEGALSWQQLEDYDYLILLSEDESSVQYLNALGIPAGEQVYKLAEYR